MRPRGRTAIFELDVAGGRLVGEVAGAGPAVVLLHAGVADHRMWNRVAPGLAEAYQVIRFDFRGYGQSPPSDQPYRQVDDVVAVLDSLGVDRAHLVGASMGGAVALELALSQSGRVWSLSLLASSLSGYDFSPEIEAYWETEQAALSRGDIDAVVELNLDVWVRGSGREWSERSLAEAAELRDALRVIAINQSNFEDLSLGPETPVLPRLAEVAVPALVVVAESDPSDLARIGELLGGRLPNARVVRMPDTAHLPALERPAETLDVLLAFLKDCRSATAA